MNYKLSLSVGSFLLALGTSLGAFGAHALQDVLSPERLQTWETAVSYQMWNALGLILIGLISKVLSLEFKKESLGLCIGILIFSGSLYTLCLTNIGWFGAITPAGGVLMIISWIVVGIKLVKAPDT